MKSRLKLSPHAHSGHLRDHEFTSYLPLAVLLAVVGMILGVFTASAVSHPAPQAGSIGLSGIMPGKPPTVAPTITSPGAGQHFTTSPVTVSGACPKNTLVEVYKNDIFGGSTPCSSSGNFSLQVDLLIGTNTLIARAYDALNQSSPDSSQVTASYDILPAQAGGISPLSFGSGSQLLLNTSAVFRGVFPGQPMSIPISLLGGAPPYAVNVQWGDSSNKVVPASTGNTFTISHTYQKPGTFRIDIQATDSQGRIAFLTVAAIVNGQPDATASTSGSGEGNGNQPIMTELLVLWPLYTASVAVLISFWLGERREQWLLKRQYAIITN